MSNYWLLYLLTRLDAIVGVSIAVSIILAFIAGIAWMVSWIQLDLDDEFHEKTEIEKKKSKLWRLTRKCIWFIGIFTLIAVFLPSKNEAIFIWAGGKTLNWAEQDTSLSKLPSQTTLLIEKYMDKQLKDIDSQISDTTATKK